MIFGGFNGEKIKPNKPNPSGTNCRTGLLAFSVLRQDEEREVEKTNPILDKSKSKKAKMRVNPVFIRVNSCLS